MASRLQKSLRTVRLQRPLQQQWQKSFSTTPMQSLSSKTPEGELQSQATKSENFRQAAEDIGIKMQAAPHSITSEEAAHLKSREARATGQQQPPSDSISAEAQRMAAENEGATKPKGVQADPVEQSAADRAANFENVAEEVGEKLAFDPGSITKEDAGKIHSKEQKAFGNTAKGGIASEVHKVADENVKKGRV